MGAENALLRMESGQQSFAMAALTDSGDATTFNGASSPWSRRGGFAPDVKPDGVINGGSIKPGASNDTVNVEAILCNLGGVETTVAGSTGVALTRATTDTHIINSVTVTSAGAIAVVAGAEGTSFTETRGGNGGPPYIPVGSIEVGQVRLSSQTAALVTVAQIFQVVGLHQERYDAPLYDIKPFEGQVVFAAALPTIHTGDETKGVHASFATPIFADVDPARDVVLPEETFSVSSEAFYGTSVGSVSRSLGQASFTASLKHGMRETVVKSAGEHLWFLFLPNRYTTGEYEAFDGILGVSRSWPASGGLTAACTVSCEEKSKPVGA